jgi:CBS-domain-containing membrane protein
MSNPFHSFFHQRKLDQIAEAGQAVKTLHSKNTVEDAIRTLHSNRIQSIPIVDEKSKQILGIVDILDLVKFVVSVAPDHMQLKENELRSLEIAGRAMAWKELGELVSKQRFTASPVRVLFEFSLLKFFRFVFSLCFFFLFSSL